ncbi:hypothetical protein COU20_03410 [Candidatus Kaiserbacteria bacterium CG10_big_fil_rev_8_21_14_0_10_59_10]|uniref:Histone n=1 Tax=Candidatus Kaiserbacteria bacterium CG10_big_fil_rev_8_21_14_0_10_59_10 TaxID=1974612 RepID=A0A2H0U6X8_9BACT|nr:MAG: hypothetical protein COU20_03410 [Candidatus Kaiserbacteria bacterium CG10_big_fil_rev_8_21_14_0_10_59_10]
MVKKRTQKAMGIGAGLAAAGAAAAAGYYFYVSKDAAKHRRVAAKWASGFKKEVVKQAKAVKNVNKTAVLAAVDKATEMYTRARKTDRADIMRAAEELKKNWQRVAQEVQAAAEKGARSARKTAKKTAKRTTRKKTAKRR